MPRGSPTAPCRSHEERQSENRSKITNKFLEILEPSIREGEFIKTQEEALLYLASKMSVSWVSNKYPFKAGLHKLNEKALIYLVMSILFN